MRGYASLLAARRMLSSGACVAVLCLGGCEWPIFLSLRWHLAAALATDPAPLAAAVVAARQAFENREAEGQAEGEAGGEAAARLQLGRWLYVVGRAEEALELLAAAGCAEHEAERCFLAGLCWRRLRPEGGEAARLLEAAAEQRHRGAARRLRKASTLSEQSVVKVTKSEWPAATTPTTSSSHLQLAK